MRNFEKKTGQKGRFGHLMENVDQKNSHVFLPRTPLKFSIYWRQGKVPLEKLR